MINRATLTGRLTRNIDLRYTPSGIAVGNFTLAVDRQFVNKNGQRDADFIRCTIWRKPAENLANFTHKGSLIGIDGQIRTGSYKNQQGETVYTTTVVVDNFALLESKRQTQATAPQQPQMPQQPQQPRQQQMPQQPQQPMSQQPNQQQMSQRPQQPQQPRQPQQPQSRQPQQPQGNQNQPSSNAGNGMPKGSKKIDISNDDLPF